ncbi:hypothetical protein CMV_024907 [Castanea mollissima]|uniref:Uncharacterized protein n=1 Tax=Castanea mollissima TaxID=60419 RepID=A0A8J4VHH5_9ROSI|nr:hypothetical protein CMV_024907 [Castanea mollissima]
MCYSNQPTTQQPPPQSFCHCYRNHVSRRKTRGATVMTNWSHSSCTGFIFRCHIFVYPKYCSWQPEFKFPAIKFGSFLVISASAILPLASTLPQSTSGSSLTVNCALLIEVLIQSLTTWVLLCEGSSLSSYSCICNHAFHFHHINSSLSYLDVKMCVLGSHQLQNVANATHATLCLHNQVLKVIRQIEKCTRLQELSQVYYALIGPLE